MKYEVFLSTEAETDLLAICSYIEAKDSRESADRIFHGLKQTVLVLKNFLNVAMFLQNLKEFTYAIILKYISNLIALFTESVGTEYSYMQYLMEEETFKTPSLIE